jgi:type IV pilus assembly protein PilM
MIKREFNFRLSFLSSAPPPLIGVDIGSSAIKMVELNRSAQGRFELNHYAIEPLPSDAMIDGGINKIEVVGDALRRAWTRMGTRTRKACMSLPTSSVVTKKIWLPSALVDEDLEIQVETEASQYIPFAMDEVNLDFQPIGPAPGNNDETIYFMVATRKANVEDRVAAAQAAGLKTTIVDVDSFAAQAAFDLVRPGLPAASATEQIVALVDIGSHLISVNVMRNGESVYTRDHQTGGDVLNRQIQSMYGLSAEEAEIGKRKGGLPDGYEQDILAPFCDNIGAEIARSIQFFYSATPYTEVHHLVLCGGGCMLKGLPQAVSRHTGISTVVANPFADMQVSSKISARQLLLDAPTLMIACGLAMRRFDPK